MISFENDYIAGAHPKILERLIETNLESLSGYGNDMYCQSACEKIKKACKCEDAQVFFATGGTQTNAVVISAMLHDYEGVVAAVTGHVSAHEAGAIEYTGHKVLTLPQHDGKIDAEELGKYLRTFYEDINHEHMVFPGMVYISHPTEYGTLYSKKELEQISQICNKYRIPLFLDGARLGYGLMSKQTDVTLPDIANLCDVFYIGGTKVGALCGEAIVFTKKNAPMHFMTIVKQHGALLAKGRLLGIQFDTLFTDNLYFEISSHAIEMAEQLKEVLKEKGCTFYLESPTNQQFIVMENCKLDELKTKLAFSFWEKADDTHTVIRLATGWSTKMEDIKQLRELL
ncbi:MAG: aminotransferase class I/II-fold pyridoxal phosphate-dependent enzyme [Lachnospiraceae bacterium]|nr:aminotransferase class I/II-fold pyridoxal phosphate-dependent enzyme [Lachnospiraceae bacterium]